MPLLFRDLPPLYAFPFILIFSTVVAVVVCLLTPAESDEVLDNFYLTVRPWGLWRPVHRRLLGRFPDLARNNRFFWDMGNCALGIAWQTSIVLLPIYIVLRRDGPFWLAMLAVAFTSLVLKKTWYDRLGPGDGFLPEDHRYRDAD
jgi:hypothetical protein